MKTDPRGSLLAKITAIFLAAALACGIILCALGVAFLAEGGAYSGTGSYFKSDACYSTAYSEAENIYWMWQETSEGESPWADWEELSNAGFSISEATGGAPLISVNIPAEAAFIGEYSFDYNSEKEATVTIYLPEKLTVEDNFQAVWSLFERLLSKKTTLFICAALGLVAEAAVLVFLCCAAGHRRGREDVQPNYFDRIPLDLWLAAAILGAIFCAAPLDAWYGWQEPLLLAALLTACLLGMFLLFLMTLLTLATRIKLGQFWKNTVIYRAINLLWRFVKWLWRALLDGVHSLPMAWRTTLFFAGFIILQSVFAVTAAYNQGWSLLLLLALDVCALFFACRVTLSLKKLREGGKKLAAGDSDFRVDTAKMPRTLREHGDDLNALGGGIALAVERQMKSERMKTELITNVSHDIKTPLTSILNYVDLLQKDPAPEERAEYLEVLQRQAKRLKKLTEDLVEASKAATGNIQVKLERTDLGELLRQAAGEYEERLGQNQLTPVLTLPEQPLQVMADGRLLWRVIDNLLGNACKYAQPGTRVYLDARQTGGRVALTVRNVSKTQLNIDAQELMERFVRGDSSRNTEGSGLGLNIAKSLTELQGGELELAIDGDLFKASVSFPAAQ